MLGGVLTFRLVNRGVCVLHKSVSQSFGGRIAVSLMLELANEPEWLLLCVKPY